MTNNSEKVKMMNGLSIFGFKNDHLIDIIKKHGGYERELDIFLGNFLGRDKGAICLDIGANIGIHTLTMALHANKTYAFEPIPEVFELLSKSVNENKLNKKTALFNFGLSNKNCALDIAINRDGNIGASSILDDTLKAHISYKYERKSIFVKKGDEVVKENSISRLDFIKMDIEGHETEAILGLKETIKKFRPVICLEWNCDKTRNGFKENDFFNNIFKDYDVGTLARDNPIEGILTKSFFVTWLSRIFPKTIIKFLKFLRMKVIKLFNSAILNEFDEARDYGCVLLFPKEKRKDVNENINFRNR
jgi:FkbM family methyltransferase